LFLQGNTVIFPDSQKELLVKMKLTLLIATFVVAVGVASSLRTFAPYVLTQNGLEPDTFVVLTPKQEVESEEISSQDEESKDSNNRETFMVR
jgi:hypothetical protein